MPAWATLAVFMVTLIMNLFQTLHWHSLKRLIVTRWSGHLQAVTTIYEDREVVVAALRSGDSSQGHLSPIWKSAQIMKAQGLLNLLETPVNVFLLKFLYRVVPVEGMYRRFGA